MFHDHLERSAVCLNIQSFELTKKVQRLKIGQTAKPINMRDSNKSHLSCRPDIEFVSPNALQRRDATLVCREIQFFHFQFVTYKRPSSKFNLGSRKKRTKHLDLGIKTIFAKYCAATHFTILQHSQMRMVM